MYTRTKVGLVEHHSCELLNSYLTKVERRLRITVIGWMLSLAALILFGLPVQQAISQQSVLRAKRIELVDSSGTTRIVLEADEDKIHDSRILMTDASGKLLRFLVTTNRVGASVALYGSAPIFTMIDPERNPNAHVRINLAGGFPSIEVKDKDGYSSTFGVEVLKAATGTVENRSAASLVLFDNNGKVIWKTP